MPQPDLSPAAMQALAKLIVSAELDPPEIAETAVKKGLVNFGFTFMQFAVAGTRDDPERQARVTDLIFQVGKSWLKGDRISSKGDEDERRARFALEIAKINPVLTRLAADAVFRLPEGHPLRDTAAIRESLVNLFNSATGARYPDVSISPPPEQTGIALLAVTGLADHRLLPSDDLLALIDAGEKWSNESPSEDHHREFRLAAASHFLSRAIAARDQGDAEARRGWTARAKAVFAPVVQTGPLVPETDRQDRLVWGLIEEVESDEAGTDAGFGALAGIVHPGGRPDALSLISARLIARKIYNAGRYADAVRLLSPVLPELANQYLAAGSEDEIRSAGESFSECSTIQAFAYAQLGQWGRALDALDRAKSLRTRWLAALQASDAGRRALELESAMHDYHRGVAEKELKLEDAPPEDIVAQQLTFRSRLLEAYGSVRRSLTADRIGSTGVRRMARCLARREGVLIIGLANFGVLLAIVRRGDYRKPSFTSLLPAESAMRLLNRLADDDGWMMVSQTPGLRDDPRPALSEWLQQTDEVIGAEIAPFLRRTGLRRLIVVPHGVLQVTPFWLLPSLAPVEVIAAPTAAHATSVNAQPKPAGGSAAVIADPTLDLALTRAECAAVAKHLTAAGLYVERIEGADAVAANVTQRVRGASILHFSGHGRSDILHPATSGLELYADAGNLGLGAEDPLSELARDASWSTLGDDNRRSAPISGLGTLTEQYFPADRRVERRLEHAGGTLLGTYRWLAGDPRLPYPPLVELVRLASLWTAAGILKAGVFEQCRLAFLSSCDAAMGGLGHPVDEYAGLPAALQIAGVSTVVAPLWPVEAGLAALFADLFYAALAEARDEADVPSLVASIRARLRAMARDEASQRLMSIAAQAERPPVALMGEAMAQQIADGPEYPFEHPYDWGAFHVLGVARLRLGERRPLTLWLRSVLRLGRWSAAAARGSP